MLVELFEELGGFFGAKYGVNKEAFEFLRFHEEILRNMGGAWDEVSPLLNDKIYDAAISEQICAHIKSYSRRKAIKEYERLGMSKLFWGWKDPRNCLFVNFWLQAYPQAKVIFIYRNPLDVAKSLKVRSDKGVLSGEWIEGVPLKTKLRDSLRENRSYPLQSIRCRDLGSALQLWEDYNILALKNLDGVDYLSVRYEDLLSNPLNILSDIESYLFRDRNMIPQFKKIGEKINSSRAYACSVDEFSEENLNWLKKSEILRKFGYEGLVE
ncbi:sulfotransferase [Spongiibacter nanhainus]|uniref:Sulfotransferase n=2 Tax=Spongiibacter nanhainus TaxID=2794344 RepID=A0A7T4URN6_9GAMM|nr:sulfotransferase [Spongiibacter nanhainus]